MQSFEHNAKLCFFIYIYISQQQANWQWQGTISTKEVVSMIVLINYIHISTNLIPFPCNKHSIVHVFDLISDLQFPIL